MLASSIPPKFPIPWANAAGGAFIRAIPEASQIGILNGAASLTDGFPPINFTPVGAGGVPSFGQDWNGILKQITQWSQWQGAGGLAGYDPTFSADVGGYMQGSLLAGAAAGVLWLSEVDNNVTDPDTGGAGWLQVPAGPVATALIANNAVTNAKLAQAAAWTLKGNATANTANETDMSTATARAMVGFALAGHLWGLTLSNDASTPASVLDIAAGEASSDASAPTLMVLPSAITKSIASNWAAGSGNGGLDTGTVTNGSYHVFQIAKADGSSVDVLFSASPTAPTLPTGYTLKRRIGSMIRASGSIVAFTQDGDYFAWNTSTPPRDLNNSGARSKSALTVTLPSGIRIRGIFSITVQNGHTSPDTLMWVGLYDGNTTNVAQIFGNGISGDTVGIAQGTLEQWTNTAAQVQCTVNVSDTGTGTVDTLGWVDTRGR